MKLSEADSLKKSNEQSQFNLKSWKATRLHAERWHEWGEYLRYLFIELNNHKSSI